MTDKVEKEPELNQSQENNSEWCKNFDFLAESSKNLNGTSQSNDRTKQSDKDNAGVASILDNGFHIGGLNEKTSNITAKGEEKGIGKAPVDPGKAKDSGRDPVDPGKAKDSGKDPVDSGVAKNIGKEHQDPGKVKDGIRYPSGKSETSPRGSGTGITDNAPDSSKRDEKSQQKTDPEFDRKTKESFDKIKKLVDDELKKSKGADNIQINPNEFFSDSKSAGLQKASGKIDEAIKKDLTNDLFGNSDASKSRESKGSTSAEKATNKPENEKKEIIEQYKPFNSDNAVTKVRDKDGVTETRTDAKGQPTLVTRYNNDGTRREDVYRPDANGNAKISSTLKWDANNKLTFESKTSPDGKSVTERHYKPEDQTKDSDGQAVRNKFTQKDYRIDEKTNKPVLEKEKVVAENSSLETKYAADGRTPVSRTHRDAKSGLQVETKYAEDGRTPVSKTLNNYDGTVLKALSLDSKKESSQANPSKEAEKKFTENLSKAGFKDLNKDGHAQKPENEKLGNPKDLKIDLLKTSGKELDPKKSSPAEKQDIKNNQNAEAEKRAGSQNAPESKNNADEKKVPQEQPKLIIHKNAEKEIQSITVLAEKDLSKKK